MRYYILLFLVIILTACGNNQTETLTLPTEASFPTETPTSTPSETPLPSNTPIPTNTATATMTNTATATHTPTSTNTPLPSATALPTNTATPIPTLSNEDRVTEAVREVFGRGRSERIDTIVVNDIVVTLRFPLSDFTPLTEAELQLPLLVCELRDAGFTNRMYQITGTIAVVDAFGNEGTAEGVEVILPADVVANINCEAARNFMVNLAPIAERYDINPLLLD